MSKEIEIDDGVQLNLRTLIDVLTHYQGAAFLNNHDTDDWKIFLKIDNKEYAAHTIWFNSLDKQKLCLCHYTEPPKVAFDSTKDELL